MEHFVTLFNSLFLPQGLALHASMERHVKDYTLWILCVDDEAFDILVKLKLPNIQLLRLSEYETEELLEVKLDRTIGEYCWTLTPFAPRFVFEADASVERATYIDADLWFRKDPEPIFREFVTTGKDVLITDHAYAPEYDQSAASGQYCVQFMIFTRGGGEVVRKWWEEQCIEWCFARVEDGRFGDQKYLDDWPERFSSHVHVLADKELALAPWNAIRFPYSNAIFWHFHGLRLWSSNTKMMVFYGTYSLPKPTLQYVYQSYVDDLRQVISKLSDIGYRPTRQREEVKFLERIRGVLRGGYQLFWRINQRISTRL